jgi:hypothetical protein
MGRGKLSPSLKGGYARPVSLEGFPHSCKGMCAKEREGEYERDREKERERKI